MQVRAARLVGLAVTLAAGLSFAAPAMAVPLDVHTPPRPEKVVPPTLPDITAPGPRRLPDVHDSCILPARAAAPVDPCQPPASCIRPAVHRGPPPTACLPDRARPKDDDHVGPPWPLVPPGLGASSR